MELGPATSLSKNVVLKWVLKSILLMPIDLNKSTATGTSSASSGVFNIQVYYDSSETHAAE